MDIRRFARMTAGSDQVVVERHMILTEQLHGLIHNYPAEHRMELANIIADSVEKNIEALEQTQDKKAWLWDLYQQADKEVEKLKKIHPPSCKKGCAFCCKIEVKITDIEGELLMDYIEDDPFDEDEIAMLERQAQIPTGHEYSLHEDRTCVFLTEDNECSVYEARPLACRTYMVKSDPKECDAMLNGGAGVWTISGVPSETMRSTLYAARPNDRMANILLKLHKQREDGKRINNQNDQQGA